MDTKLAALYDLGQKLLLLQDAEQISETVLEIADDVLDFGDSEFLLLDEATQELWVAAHRGELDVAAGLRLPMDGERGITVASARSGAPLYVPNVPEDPRYVDVGFAATSELAVPVQFEGRVLGVINVESEEADAYSPSDVQLLSILASQAALALQNARVHAQERRRAEEMAAINRVARRVSATLDLRETLDSIVDAAAELVPCVLAEISLWDEGEQALTLQALRSEPERAFAIGKTYPPGEGYTGWVVGQRQPLLVKDVEARDDPKPDLLPGEQAFESYVGVPLLAGDELIGTLVLIHDRADAFDEQDLELLQGLAGQAAIAIRNAALYEELARRHRELAALNAVAAASNRALDVDMALESILADAVDRVIQCLGADAGGIRLLDAASGQLTLSFTQGMSEAYTSAVARLGLGEGIVGDVAVTGEPALVHDMQRDLRLQPGVPAKLREEGLRSLAVVPLRSRQELVGTLGVASRTPAAFRESDVDLLTALGHQIGVAITNARLFDETQRKARKLAALNAVAQVISQSDTLQDTIDQAVAKVAEVMEVEISSLRLLEEDAGELSVVSHRGLSASYLQAEAHIRVTDDDPVAHVARSGEPLVVCDLVDDASAAGLTFTTDEFKAFAIVPVRARDRIAGTLRVASRSPRDFDREELDLLTAIGHQLGTAVDNARLRQEALDAARLAAIGRVAASVAHELRGPMGGIMRSAEFLARPELSDSTRAKLSQAIVAMAGRLMTTTQELLDYSKGGRLALTRVPCPLSSFMEEVLEVLRVDFSDRGIEVRTDWGYPSDIWLDADRMAQVVYNIAANARDAMPEGGLLRVATRQVGECVELRFSDTGPGIQAHLRERIFEPFVSYGKGKGAGLGLAIARRIVRQHGGEISLDGQVQEGATFVVRLPREAPLDAAPGYSA
ncbi:MAG: GAF domain-containing protein [Anaerolineae bacterium]|jgi:GAF domain-containing protein